MCAIAVVGGNRNVTKRTFLHEKVRRLVTYVRRFYTTEIEERIPSNETEYQIRMVLHNATSALHLVSDQEDRSALSSSPRDVAEICDFVFGDVDNNLALPKLCEKRKQFNEDSKAIISNKRLCKRSSVRNLSCLTLTQKMSGDEEDDWMYLNSIQPISVDGLVSTGSETTLEETSSVTLSTIGNVSTDSGESYGWFVRTDCDDSDCVGAEVNPYSNQKAADLAFSASVAPIRTTSADEQELAWCTAADTVDDVLADFF